MKESNEMSNYETCRVEGCDYEEKGCGLAKLKIPYWLPIKVNDICLANILAEKVIAKLEAEGIYDFS